MPRKVKLDIPGRDFRVSPTDVYAKGWEESFAPDLSPPLELVVDIGFGDGHFIEALASRNPSHAHVGIERRFKRVLKAARRIARTEIANVRLVEAPAESAVEELFGEASVRTFWINFPDPWPKERHAGRRLVQADFIHELACRLVPGGDLLLATDDPLYAEQFDAVLSMEPLLENRYTPARWRREAPERIETTFERGWREEGRALHFFTYRRRNEAVADFSSSQPRTP